MIEEDPVHDDEDHEEHDHHVPNDDDRGDTEEDFDVKMKK